MWLFLVPLLAAQSPIESHPISIRETAIPISKAIEEIARQSGIPIRFNRRGADESIAVDLDRATFWQALDTVAARTKSRVQLGRDLALSLVPLGPTDRGPPTDYDGEFRVRVIKLAATRDLNSDRGNSVFTLEVVWTPTLRPLFLDSQAYAVRLLDSSKKSIPITEERGTLSPVDGRLEYQFEVTAPLLPRADPRISLLEGKLNAVVPSKFLTFRFDADLSSLKDAVAGGAVRRLVQDEVVCRVERVVLEKERWSVRMALEYPAGGKELESFQAGSLIVHNELTLISSDGKRTMSPSNYVIDTVSSQRAIVTYHFIDKPGARRGNANEWKLRYSAPARIVEVPIRFRFRDVPLP